MSELYKFKVYCSTDSQWEYIWSETPPTECPVNAGHTIVSSSISVNEKDKLKVKTIDSSDSPYRQKKDSLYIDTSGGNITIELMKAKKGQGRIYYLKKTSASNIITLDPYESELIDGQATKTMTDLNEIILLTSDGTTWTSYSNENDTVVNIDPDIQDNVDITGAKGELLVDNGEELSILEPGTDGQVLTMDSTTDLGIKWTSETEPSYGHLFWENNATETTISSISTLYKAAGTSIAGQLGYFTHSNNKLTYTGATTQTFKAVVVANLKSAGGSGKTVSLSIHKNGSQVGALIKDIMDSGDIYAFTNNIVTSLSTNDYLEVYVSNNESTDNIIVENLNLTVASIGGKGQTGNQGPAGADGTDGAPGSGSTLIVKDEGTNVTNTPHSAFNFVGGGVSVTDGGSGVATITIAPVFGSEYNYTEALSTSTTTMETWVQKLRLTTSSLPNGNYKLTWSAEFSNIDNDKGMAVRLEQDDTTEIAYNGSGAKLEGGIVPWHSFSGNRKLTLSGVKTFDIDYLRGTGGGTAQIRRATLELFRIS